ncbi:MAG: hypothetical protein HYT47_01390 [Candidatus Vogelbacteria bacterium]|nr:hypothetical protein [Candidatus Vogelbacteria bacterium]
MTTRLITSDQKKQFKRFVEDASDRALKETALDREGLQRLLGKGGKFQAYVMAGIRRYTTKVPDYELAKSILGQDFILPEEIAKARGVFYTGEQLAKFDETLPAPDALEWCRDNSMMLVAGPPRAMSFLDVRAIKTDFFYPKTAGWYLNKKQKFSHRDKVEPIWIALRKEPIADSFAKNWGEQNELIAAPMVVPNAAEAVWGLTTYKAVRDIYLLPNLYVRTSSLDSFGHRVGVGFFDAKGLDVSLWNDDYRYDRVGLSSARKF